jgi:antitoxin YefM
MREISYSDALNGFATLLDSVFRDRESITITGNEAGSVVLLAAEKFAGMEETLHLLSTPANADRIREGLADFAAGNVRQGVLCD